MQGCYRHSSEPTFLLLLFINLPYDSIGAAVHFLYVIVFKTVFECMSFNKMKDNSPRKVLHSKLHVLLHSEQVI